MPHRTEEAYEVVTAPGGLDLVLTCEHASQRVPDPWEWPAADRWLVGTHWAYDIGAAELVVELLEAVGGVAVLSRFTRLLADPNRPERSETLFRSDADGHPVELNRALSEKERSRRLDRLWRPYHRAVDEVVAGSESAMVLSMHTFTPVYEGAHRRLEVGVLFDREEGLAHALRDALAADGFEAELNEPYSGKEGLIYAVDRHASAHGRRPVELEVRQDLAVDDFFRERLVRTLARWLEAQAR